MEHTILVSRYLFNKHHYKYIHSAGPETHFKHPSICYVKKGYAKFLYNDNTFYAHEGDLIYVACGTKYQSIWYGSPDIEWYSVDFYFKSQYDFIEYPFQILKNYPPTLFDKMFETHQISYMLSISYFYQLLDDIYKKLNTTSAHPLCSTIVPAIEYIEKNYNQNFYINTLAELCKCSESAFFKLFKKSTGVTPVSYKHSIMIQKAIDLLVNTTLSIEEISSQIGFSSSNHFRTIFSKLTGKTPKELRKNNSSAFFRNHQPDNFSPANNLPQIELHKKTVD